MIELYEPTAVNDIRLLRWYGALQTSGEFNTLFTAASAPLSRWFAFWQQPNLLLYAVDDEDNIYFATWFVPVMAGAFASTWVRADKRQSKETLALIDQTWNMGLQVYGLLISATAQAKVMNELVRLGWTYIGTVPRLFEGDSAYILHLTRDAPRTMARGLDSKGKQDGKAGQRGIPTVV